MKRVLLILGLLLVQQLWAQSENQPLRRSIEVDPQSKSLLKVPKDNALPIFCKRIFYRTPPTQQSA